MLVRTVSAGCVRPLGVHTHARGVQYARKQHGVTVRSVWLSSASQRHPWVVAMRAAMGLCLLCPGQALGSQLICGYPSPPDWLSPTVGQPRAVAFSLSDYNARSEAHTGILPPTN